MHSFRTFGRLLDSLHKSYFLQTATAAFSNSNNYYCKKIELDGLIFRVGLDLSDLSNLVPGPFYSFLSK